jgi:ketosteroid isomerase-like protein
MTAQTNVEVIQGIYAAFGRGDVAAILGVMDPQAELIFEAAEAIPWSGHFKGRDGWGSFFQAVGTSLDEVALQMTPFAVQGDNVVVAGRYQGRVKRTGKRIDSPLVHLWTVRNGLVVRCQEMTNTAAEAAACS